MTRSTTKKSTKPTKPTKLYWGEDDIVNIAKVSKHRRVGTDMQFFAHHAGMMYAQWYDEKDLSHDLVRTYYGLHNPIKRKISITNHYNDLLIASMRDKQDYNNIFVEAAENSTRLLPGQHVVYLDAQSGLTTKTLAIRNLNASLVAVNCDPGICASIASLASCQVRCGMLNDITSSFTTRSIAAIWADYCSTWEGTCGCCPKRDMLQLYQSGTLSRGSLIALTVCLRDVRKGGSSFLFEMAKIHSWNQRILRQYYPHGSKTVLSEIYRHHMYILILKLK
jgi:hypothetical protein